MAEDIAPLLAGLDTSFRISPLSLIPILVMVVCIVIKFPAIPAVMAGVVSGLIVAVAAQSMPFGDIFTTGFPGYVGHTGVALLDELLTADGIESIMHANSIVIITMAYGGLMQKTGQMYAEEYDRRGISRVDLSRALLCGGVITSPLVPWNTCGIYRSGILGVATLSHLPYTFLGLFLPLRIVLSLGGSLLRAKKPSHPPMQHQTRRAKRLRFFYAAKDKKQRLPALLFPLAGQISCMV